MGCNGVQLSVQRAHASLPNGARMCCPLAPRASHAVQPNMVGRQASGAQRQMPHAAGRLDDAAGCRWGGQLRAPRQGSAAPLTAHPWLPHWLAMRGGAFSGPGRTLLMSMPAGVWYLATVIATADPSDSSTSVCEVQRWGGVGVGGKGGGPTS